MVRWLSIGLSPLAFLGYKTRSAFRYLAVLSVFAYLPIKRTLSPPFIGSTSIIKTTVMQIYFTGVQALPLFLFLSILTGWSLATFLEMARGVQVQLCNLIIMHATPIMVAFIVLGRSGTAITVELGNMTVFKEIRHLRRMGIDPFQHVIFPRLVGVTTATLFMGLFFGTAMTLTAALFSNSPVHVFIQDILKDWSAADVLLIAEEEILFGMIISMVACYQGLNLIPLTTEVPKATIRTVIQCIILCAMVDFLFKIARL